MDNFDMNQNSMKINVNNFHIPKNSCVLPGKSIFELINYGTKFSNLDLESQKEKIYSLIDNFDSDIEQIFKSVIADIAEETQSDGVKS